MPGPRIISGGQTGVDQAALDAARELGLPYGGFVPQGRWTEDGPLPLDYVGMVETEARHPEVRTKLNVRASDATIIFSRGPCEGGTLLTLLTARDHGVPHLHIDLSVGGGSLIAARIRSWLGDLRPGIVNVGGPRASKDPAIYQEVKAILAAALTPQSSD
jgi:hypothetical protein